MTFSKEQLERYSRQIIIPEIGREGQEKLASGRVLVIGAGGLGSAALFYLAAAGVGTIGIADHDVVELSNLERQILHQTSRLGKAKVESAARTLRDLNPDVRVVPYHLRITPENISELMDGYDLVLDCTDQFKNKLMINDACVLARKPFVHAGVRETAGQIMTWVPGNWPCLRCLIGASAAGADLTPPGVLGAAVGVISSMQALEAIKFLLGQGNLLTGRMLHFDGLRMTFSETVLPERSPYCSVCGDRGERTHDAGRA